MSEDISETAESRAYEYCIFDFKDHRNSAFGYFMSDPVDFISSHFLSDQRRGRREDFVTGIFLVALSDNTVRSSMDGSGI